MKKKGRIIALVIISIIVIKILLVGQELCDKAIEMKTNYYNYYNELETIYSEL